MPSPPSSTPSKTNKTRFADDAIWKTHVQKLLESPPDNYFEKKIQRKHSMPKIVPSDEQCRYLWRFYTSSNEKNEAKRVATSTNKKCIVGIARVDRMKGCESRSASWMTDEASSQSVGISDSVGASSCKLSLVTPMSSQSSHQRDVISKIDAYRIKETFEPSKKRQRTSVFNGSGWITKSNFYTTDIMPIDRRKESSRDNNSSGKQDNGNTGGFKRVDQGRLSPDRSSVGPVARIDIGTKLLASEAATVVRTPQNLDDDDSSIVSPSSEKRITANRLKHRKRSLFRPTARRANQRLKQKSIKQMFGGK